MSRTMKDSGIPWIGEIPEGWKVKRLKQESVFINGFAFDSEDFKVDEGVRVIRIGDIGLRADFESCVRAITNPYILNPYRIENGDILIAMSGATTGKCCIVDEVKEAYINQRVGIIRSNLCKIIYYSLQTPYFMEFVNLNNAGSAQPNISSKAIGEFPILLPPLAEQHLIATFLDKKCSEIDSLIDLQEQMIEELKAYKQSVITEAVTKGLNPNVPMKDSGIEWIGDVPEEWEVKPIKWDFDIIAGATPKSDNVEFWDGDIPWITPADYKTEDRRVSVGKRFITQKGLESCATALLPAGSVIFSKRAPIGLVVVNSQPLCTNQGCLGCIPRNANSVFFYYTMSAFAEQYELYGSGTTFKEISAANFADFRLPYPPLAEQQAIADYLDKKCGEIDELITIKQQKIESLKEYKKSVIYEYVTGKREV